MSTQPVSQQRPRREMQEVKAPEQYKFSKLGATIEGVLTSIDQIEVNSKPTMEYMFTTENGDRITCLGTADLDKKIQPQHLGHFMTIRYESDDASFQKAGQSAMKRFKVLADKNITPGFEHLQAA
jgi:hypothetical protein